MRRRGCGAAPGCAIVPLMPELSALPRPARRVAVIGAGVAGLTAAHLLQHRFDVVLFERETRPGGHTNTIVIPDGPDAGLAVDTGFIVFNDRNYPRFRALLAELGVASQPSDMTFSYHEEAGGFHYAGTGLDGLFSHRPSLLSPGWWGTLADVFRFNARARRDLASGALAGLTLGDYLDRLKLSRNFATRYLIPMGAAIWSASRDDLRGFPAESFLRFFEQHGLLGVTGAPQWATVTGGSQTYVRALLARFRGAVRLGAAARVARRTEGGVEVAVAGAGAERFDHVVIAAHADEALPRRVVDHHPDGRAVVVHQAERRAEPRHAPRGVRRAVERVDDDDRRRRQPSGGSGDAALLRQYPVARSVEQVEAGRIGVEVDRVLALTHARRTPVRVPCEDRSDRVGGGEEHIGDTGEVVGGRAVCRHGHRP